LTFTFRFKDYSRAVFFIDWLILLFLVTGSRFLFRLLDEFFSRLHNGEKRVFIFGAGDAGEIVIREIKRNRALRYNPVGFIDDDPAKIGNKIHGVPILGSRHRIKDLIKEYAISEIIIAIPSIDAQNFSEIETICKDCNIPYKNVKGILG
jgi:UDP-GlcNAc:undecaprenyl-phosphate GlcNAc-1-phosphate transferase